jgi:hypothetical protein
VGSSVGISSIWFHALLRFSYSLYFYSECAHVLFWTRDRFVYYFTVSNYMIHPNSVLISGVGDESQMEKSPIGVAEHFIGAEERKGSLLIYRGSRQLLFPLLPQWRWVEWLLALTLTSPGAL